MKIFLKHSLWAFLDNTNWLFLYWIHCLLVCFFNLVDHSSKQATNSCITTLQLWHYPLESVKIKVSWLIIDTHHLSFTLASSQASLWSRRWRSDTHRGTLSSSRLPLSGIGLCARFTYLFCLFSWWSFCFFCLFCFRLFSFDFLLYSCLFLGLNHRKLPLSIFLWP